MTYCNLLNSGFSPSIFDLSVADTTNTTVALMWDLPFPTVIPDIYTIYYNYTELSGAVPRTGENTINVTDTSSTYYTITDLLPYTMYDVSVVAVYNNVSSNDVTTNAETMEGGIIIIIIIGSDCFIIIIIIIVSSPVTNLSIEVNLDTMMFDIMWSGPQYPAGIIVSYTLSVAEDILNITSPTLQTSITFDFFVNYTFTIFAVNGFGSGETSTTMMSSPEGGMLEYVYNIY